MTTLLLVVLFLSACEEFAELGGEQDPILPPMTADQQLAQAQRSYNSGLFGQAQSGFAGILAQNPDNTAAMVGLGNSLLQLDQHGDAIEVYQDAIRRGAPASLTAEAHLGIGLAERAQGNDGAARAALEKSVEADADLWRGWLALGQLHQASGRRTLAKAAFENVERAGVDQAIAQNEIGMWHLEGKRSADAIRSFQNAIELDPTLEVARGNIRLAHAVAGDYETAVRGASSAELPEVLNNVGYIAIVNEDYEIAQSLLEQAVSSSPYYNAPAVANLKLLQGLRAAQSGAG